MKRYAIIALISFLIVGAGRGYSADTLHTVITLKPPPTPGHWAPSISGAGDVNTDGLADFLVGSTRYAECYLYHGKAQLDTVPDIIIPCPETHPDDLLNGFGSTVSGGRDVNGDDFDDILITNNEWFYATGKVYLYYGGPSMDVEPDIGLASNSSSWITFFWAKMIHGSLIGDLNGDGFDELAVRVWEPGDSGAYVYFGGAPMDSIHDLGLRGDQYPDVFAGAYIADGDVNGDRWLDVVVSVLSHSGGEGEGKAAWVYYGGPLLDSIPDVNLSIPDEAAFCPVCIPGDMNGDGYDDIVLADSHFSADSYPRFAVYFGGRQMDGEYDMRFSGKVLCSWPRLTGGDINNDGFADLIVSEVAYYPNDEGRLAVYFGGADMDTVPDIEIYGPGSFGATLAWIGDMTGDGWPEFAVSNPSGAGEIYIYTMGEVQAGETPVLPRIGELRIVPNPSRGPTMIGFDGEGMSGTTVGVYDLGGHLVHRLGSAGQRDEACWLLWDGTNTSGQAVPAGTYVIRVQAQDRIMSGNVVVNR